jgi:hypothetical protein
MVKKYSAIPSVVPGLLAITSAMSFLKQYNVIIFVRDPVKNFPALIALP